MMHFGKGNRLGIGLLGLPLVLGLLVSCGDALTDVAGAAESCMKCHNGTLGNDYAGPGIENPHPFPGADNIRCSTCHGGNPNGADKDSSHVPPPPQIGDRDYQDNNNEAYFNKLTLTGIDKYPDYDVDGKTYTALQFLQFVNPGDLRVVTKGLGCGQCHSNHAETVARSPLATETGIFSGSSYAMGTANRFTGRIEYENTAADMGFRPVSDAGYAFDSNFVGPVANLIEYPVYSSRKQGATPTTFKNQDYNALLLHLDLEVNGQVKSDSKLAHLFHEQVAFTCGDCHLGSAGANNRSGDYRSSGCTACHMPYSLDGRSRSSDPNLNKTEPLDPDDIDDPERPHLRSHRIVSVHKTLGNGHTVQGMDDYTCAGCHQGSNRTVMQFWGIRLDQNQDVRRGNQYPANPVKFTNTAQDQRLFPDGYDNREFNGRNANQYLLFEDYDGDNRDDTPADVHHEAGMGCIDCHGSHDLHGGDVNKAGGDKILSRMEQAVSVRCESCHGAVSTYATTKLGVDYGGTQRELAVDAKGNVMKHVYKDGSGHFWLISRLTGKKHYVRQTRDVTVNTGRKHPDTDAILYSLKASYAMGRADGSSATGIGPRQTGDDPNKAFSHTDNMSCASCHSSWTNTCMGCHLEGEYNAGNNFSNITGERIAFRERFAEFVYQSPVMFQLGVNSKNKVASFSSNTKTFFRYKDIQNRRSPVFTFSDRKGQGSSGTHPALGHNAMMAHSIRGKVSSTNEGPRYCVACHNTTKGLTDYGTQYNTFRSAMASGTYTSLDFNLLKNHIGKNPGNQMNSPLWVHMVAGLGSGLFLFDKDGCAINPLDDNDDRYGCNGQSPKDLFDLTKVKYNLDRVADVAGKSFASSNHAMQIPGTQNPNLRAGSTNPGMAGPLGGSLIDRLTNPDPAKGIILNSWIDPNGALQGNASDFVK